MFSEILFCASTVLVAKDIDNSSHLLSIDSARHPLRADAMTILIFTDKTEFQERRTNLAKHLIDGRVRIQTQSSDCKPQLLATG